MTPTTTPTTVVRVTCQDIDVAEFINSAGTRITARRKGHASSMHAAKLMLRDQGKADDEAKEALYHATGYLYRDGKISALMTQPWAEFQSWLAREAIRIAKAEAA